MADLSSLTRESRTARAMLLAFGAASLLLLPGRVAEAQVPPVDECLANPARCLPEPELPPLPEVDECVAKPAGCLPDTPPVDGCVQNPASCLPPTPEPDRCAKHPTSCLPPTVDGCVDDPEGCAPRIIDRCTEKVARCVGQDPAEDDQDEGGAPAPGNGSEPPRTSADRPGGGTQHGADAPGIDATPASSGSEGARLGPATRAGSLLEGIERGLADAAQRFAFPLAVAALVGAFLLVQGRIDRKDPKLAAAPIYSRLDVVAFR